MNLLRKPPMGQRLQAKVSDPEHLARVAQLPCCICEAFGERQRSATQVHHVFHGRYDTERAPDRMTIPLCEGHHLGMFDTSKLAIHRANHVRSDVRSIHVVPSIFFEQSPLGCVNSRP